MKKILLLAGFIACSISIFCQETFDPKVVVFSPRIVITETGISKDISFFDHYMISPQKNHLINKKDSLIDVVLKNDTLKTNEKAHLKNIIEYAPYWDFNTNMVNKYVNSLQSILNITYKNDLVIAASEKSISDVDIKRAYAEKNSFDYIISIDTLFISKARKGLYIKPILSLYDKKGKQNIDLHSTYKDRFNVEYITIKKKQLFHTKKTTKYLFYDDIESFSTLVNYIKYNGDSLKRNETNNLKDLEEKRINKLDSLFETGKKFDKDLLQNKDSILGLPTSAIITIISSRNKDKALAYFIRKEKIHYKEFSDSLDVVSVIYCNRQKQQTEYKYLIKSGSFQEISIEEKVKTEFNNLIEMNFFKENSSELNDEFWDKELFLNLFIKS